MLTYIHGMYFMVCRHTASDPCSVPGIHTHTVCLYSVGISTFAALNLILVHIPKLNIVFLPSTNILLLDSSSC